MNRRTSLNYKIGQHIEIKMANDKIRRNEEFATSMASEVRNFEWKIKDMRSIVVVDKEMKRVALEFNAGDSIGLPTQWRFYFKVQTDGKIGVLLKLLKSPKKGQPVFAEFNYGNLGIVDETNYEEVNLDDHNSGTGIHNYQESDLGFPLAYESTENLVRNLAKREDKILTVLFKFTLYNNKIEITPVFEITPKMTELDSASCAGLQEDLDKLWDSGLDADVKIQTADGKELQAHKLILGARSPVFFAMFNTEMKESASGVVFIPDLSYDALRIVLKFIYTGKMADKWEEVIEEVIHAAEKYTLPLMKEYCDRMLATTCTLENAWSLKEFAKLHGLTRAEKEISKYIKSNLGKIVEVEVDVDVDKKVGQEWKWDFNRDLVLYLAVKLFFGDC